MPIGHADNEYEGWGMIRLQEGALFHVRHLSTATLSPLSDGGDFITHTKATVTFTENQQTSGDVSTSGLERFCPNLVQFGITSYSLNEY